MSHDASNTVLPLLKVELEALDNEDYSLTKLKLDNVNASFELINSERPEKNPSRAESHDYFSAIIQESHELFIVSALAAPRALLQTFRGETAPEALQWFRTNTLPERLYWMTKMFFTKKSEY